MALVPGFEPRLPVLETGVLPLHYTNMVGWQESNPLIRRL